MKKIFALVLIAVMVMAMGSLAFAADPDYSITVTGGVKDETYSAYKMFDLSVDDPTNPTAYRYTVNPAWEAFATTPEFTAVFTVTQGNVTSNENSTATWSATSNLSKLADAAAKYAKDHNIAPKASQKATADGNVTLNVGEAGYYVIASTLGSRAMIETTPSNAAVTINEKNEKDTITKNVKEDASGIYGTQNDAQIGDTVEFKSIATIVPRSVNVKIHDTMDSGLTLNPSSIKLYTDSTLTNEYTGATINTGNNADTGDTFTILIPDAFSATTTGPQTLYIVYTAEVNKNAIVKDSSGVAVVDQNNKTKVSFGDGSSSTEGSTTTTTHSVTIFKHVKGKTDNLADAIFALKKNGTVVNLVKLDATNYRIVDDTETGTAASHVDNGSVRTIADGSIVSDFVTVSTGKITIWGLDADGDYTLTELQAPNGYNPLSGDVHLTLNAGVFAEADVENSTGSELPSTGGIGTTLFYVIGGVLAVGAAVALVSKKRMEE